MFVLFGMELFCDVIVYVVWVELGVVVVFSGIMMCMWYSDDGVLDVVLFFVMM